MDKDKDLEFLISEKDRLQGEIDRKEKELDIHTNEVDKCTKAYIEELTESIRQASKEMYTAMGFETVAHRLNFIQNNAEFNLSKAIDTAHAIALEFEILADQIETGLFDSNDYREIVESLYSHDVYKNKDEQTIYSLVADCIYIEFANMFMRIVKKIESVESKYTDNILKLRESIDNQQQQYADIVKQIYELESDKK